MINNLKLIYLYSIIVFISSCSPSESGEMTIINYDNFVEREINLSEIASDIKYIPIKGKNPFTFIYKLLDLDSFKLASIGPYIGVVKIDNSGKIINHIGKIGRGPGEYKYGIYFTVIILEIGITGSRSFTIRKQDGINILEIPLEENTKGIELRRTFEGKLIFT